MTTGTPQACASMSGIPPQRSPLISSGMTNGLCPKATRYIIAATEPAHFERDDSPASDFSSATLASPQRSPLISSGMTACARVRLDAGAGAATEPAHFERDDLVVRDGDHPGQLAATEPAHFERDDISRGSRTG